MYLKQALGAEAAPLGTKPAGSSGEPITWSGTGKTTEAVKGLFTGVLDVFKSQEAAKGAAEVYKTGLTVQPAGRGLPGWVWPVAIGGGVLLVVMMLRGRE